VAVLALHQSLSKLTSCDRGGSGLIKSLETGEHALRINVQIDELEKPRPRIKKKTFEMYRMKWKHLIILMFKERISKKEPSQCAEQTGITNRARK
jgi:hypothetical protein